MLLNIVFWFSRRLGVKKPLIFGSPPQRTDPPQQTNPQRRILCHFDSVKKNVSRSRWWRGQSDLYQIQDMSDWIYFYTSKNRMKWLIESHSIDHLEKSWGEGIGLILYPSHIFPTVLKNSLSKSNKCLIRRNLSRSITESILRWPPVNPGVWDL